MVKTIKIFNPKDRNYGVLSNNYIQPMTIGPTTRERDMDKSRKGIDAKYSYSSVTKYIYINMLTLPQYKEAMLQTNRTTSDPSKPTKPTLGAQNDLHDIFVKLLLQEKIDVIRKAIEVAYTTKIQQNPELSEKLLSTGNLPIKYVDSDEILGIGPNGNDQNLIGKYLEQIRRQLILSYKDKTNKKQQEKFDLDIYEAYIAEKALLIAIQDKGDDLRKYIRKTPTQIIDMMGRDNLIKNSQSLEVVTKLSHQGLINIPNPMHLAETIRAKELRKLRLRQQNKRLQTIFDMYADYTIKKNFPGLPLNKYADARAQLISDDSMLLEIQKKIAAKYDKGGVLSKSLSDNIDIILLGINILSEEDIIEAEAFDVNPILEPTKPNSKDDSKDDSKNLELKYADSSWRGTRRIRKVVLRRMSLPSTQEPQDTRESEEDTSVIDSEGILDQDKLKTTVENNIGYTVSYPFKETSGDPIYIYSIPKNVEEAEYYMFSHLNDDSMITIENRIYPTVSHYITFSLICAIPYFKDQDNAYKSLLVKNPKKDAKGIELFLHYDSVIREYNKLYNINFRERLIDYMHIGLDTKFQDRIAQDELLMTGDAILEWNDPSDQIFFSSKENLVGKYLMEIRKNLKKNEKIQPISVDDITTIVEKDPFLKKWLQMRTTDMCKTIYLMKSYLGEDTKVTPTLVISVLDKVYQPCSHLFIEAAKNTDSSPRFFRLMVQNCPGFNGVGEEVVVIMWRRISVMLHYLIAQDPFDTEAPFGGPRSTLITVRDIRSMLNNIENMVTNSKNCVRIMDNESDNCIASALVNLLIGIIQFNKEFINKTDIDIKEVEIATSIILNKDISGEIYPNIVDEFDSVFENIALIRILQDMPEVQDVSKIKAFIVGAIDTIKTYPMSKTVKTNRINFFATQR